MQRISTIKFDETDPAKDVTIKELSVSQVNNFLENEKMKRGFLDMLFPDRFPAVIVEQSTGISMEKLEQAFFPSELERIYDEVENLNPFFIRLMGRLVEVSKEISIEKPSTPPAAG